MKARSLALRLALNSAVMIFLVYLVMQTFVFLRDAVFLGPGTWGDFSSAVFGFVGGRVVPPLAVFTLLLWFLALPIQRAAQRLDAGEVLTEAEAEATRTRLLRFRGIVLAINLVGFTVGFLLDLLLSGRLGELAQLHRLTVLGGNLCAAFVFSAAQTALDDGALASLRDRLGITSLGNRKRETSSTTRQLRLTGALVLYALFVIQYNQHDLTVFRSWETQVLEQVRAGTLPADQAGPRYRGLVVQNLGTISSRTVADAGQIPLPWDRTAGSAAGDQEGVFVVIGLLMIGLIFGVQWAISREQKGAIATLQGRIRDVVAGGGDLRGRLALRSMDDLGELADLVNRLLDQFQGIVGRIGSAAGATRDGARAVEAELGRAEAVVAEVQASASALRAELEDQVVQARKLTEALGAFRDAAAAVDAEADSQGTFVGETSSAMEEMAASIEGVRQKSREAGGLTEALAAQGEGGGQAVLQTAQAISGIQQASDQVLKVLGALKKIASETNLLAMNAAIEAAHAGEKGAGFAVVADEVRKLATTAQGQNQAIKELIQTMARQVEAGVDRAQAAGTVLADLVKGLHTSAQASGAVAEAMEEQAARTRTVTDSLGHVVRTSGAIRSKMAAQDETTDRMAESLDRALVRLDDLAQTSRRQAEAVAGLEASFAEVRREVDRNAASSEELQSEVNRFRV